MNPEQDIAKAHHADGVDLHIAKNLIIYIDDQIHIGEPLGKICCLVNSSNLAEPLTNLSYQFIQSLELGGLEKTARLVQGLIHQAPADCKIGIVCDQDQKEFTGNQLATEIKSRYPTEVIEERFKFLAYTANSQMSVVAALWDGLGHCIPKIDTGVDTKTTVTNILNYLFYENQNT